GKNLGPLAPFTSGVCTLFFAGTGKVYRDVVLGLRDVSGCLETSCVYRSWVLILVSLLGSLDLLVVVIRSV
ncbi:hypothetical protein L195_g060248, partial [Trifolium pratense]